MKHVLLPIILSIFIFSCGIEEYFFLPQEVFVQAAFATEATIEVQPIPSELYYARGFAIYYRIYISNTDIPNVQEHDRITINSTLHSDFNALEPFTNPTNNTSVTNANTFRNRNYHELELENFNINNVISTDGGTFQIRFPNFPGDSPVLLTNPNTQEEISHDLFRNNGSGIFFQEPDRSFFYTPELVEKTDIPNNINNDVALRGNNREDMFAYVSMYIVAIGSNPQNFQPIFGKPTHINIFKLTNAH
jgi:hypothetical protein